MDNQLEVTLRGQLKLTYHKYDDIHDNKVYTGACT